MLAALLLALALNIMVVGQLRHLVAQQQLSDTFIDQLAKGTAPVSEGDFNEVLLPDGAPVGIIDIPRLGIREVIIGRAAGYGGAFGRIQELAPGAEFTILTGQGEQKFEVIGLRYAGDPSPPRLRAGESRVILTTARGVPYAPTGIA